MPVCSVCGDNKERSEFSATQKKRGCGRKCKECISTNKHNILLCKVCNQEEPASKFTKSQMKMRYQRKCKQCVKNETEHKYYGDS